MIKFELTIDDCEDKNVSINLAYALEDALKSLKNGVTSGRGFYDWDVYKKHALGTVKKNIIRIPLSLNDFLVVIEAIGDIGNIDEDIREVEVGFEAICSYELLNFLTSEQIKELASERADSVIFMLTD